MKITRISWFAILCLLTMVGFALVSAGSALSHIFRILPAQATAASAGPSETQKANVEAYTPCCTRTWPTRRNKW